MLEEVEGEEELPSLFSDDASAETEAVSETAKRSARNDASFYAATPRAQKADKKVGKRESKEKDDKSVVKDLSELAKLMGKLKK
jgi:hypothetical protein